MVASALRQIAAWGGFGEGGKLGSVRARWIWQVAHFSTDEKKDPEFQGLF
jgi:hypothetical protein